MAAVASALLATSCQNDDTNFDDLIGGDRIPPMEIDFPSDYISEEPDQVPAPTAENYNDYVESFNPSVEVSINYDGDAVTVTNPSVSVTVTASGAHVEANIRTKAVRFTLTGSSSNGSLKVVGENRFCITLAGVDLTNPDGAAINNQCSKTLYLVARDGSENSLSSTGGEAALSDAKGALFSEGQIAFSGSGILTVNSAFRNAVASDDYIFVRPGVRMAVNAYAGNALKANDGVKINGGNLNILVEADGAKGINCEDYISFSGGRTTIINNGSTRLDPVEVSAAHPLGIDTVNCAGIKTDASLTIAAGTLRVKCTGDSSKGINTDGAYSQNGGDVAIVASGQKVYSSPKGLKADASLSVTAGTLYSYSCYAAPIDSDGPIEIYHYQVQKPYLIIAGQ